MFKTFHNCNGLRSATIGNGLKLLSDYLFCNCSSLEIVNLGSGVSKIGRSVFYKCDNLKSINILNLESWLNIFYNGNLPFLDDYHLLMNGVEINDLSIPNTINNIPDYAFYGCSGLISIVIPDNITSIGSCAFQNCM